MKTKTDKDFTEPRFCLFIGGGDLWQSNKAFYRDAKICHNYIGLHESLKGKTIAEACGIDINGDNKWKSLIKNASKKTN